MDITQGGAALLFVAGFAMFIGTSYKGFTPLKTFIFVAWLILVLMAVTSNAVFVTIPLTAGAMGAITALVIRENKRRRR